MIINIKTATGDQQYQSYLNSNDYQTTQNEEDFKRL